jgi:hypothetical protein
VLEYRTGLDRSISGNARLMAIVRIMAETGGAT